MNKPDAINAPTLIQGLHACGYSKILASLLTIVMVLYSLKGLSYSWNDKELGGSGFRFSL